MLNLSLDSCVFFRMVKEYNVYVKFGMEGLIEKNRLDIEKKNKLEQELKDMLLDEYKNSNEGWRKSFINKLDFYEEYINKELLRVKGRMQKIEMQRRGYYEDANGRRFPKPKPTEKDEKQYEQDVEYLKKLEYLNSQDFKDKFIAKREEYKYLLDSIDTNKLLRKAIEGDVKFHISSTAYKEINNHIHGKSNSSDPKHLLFTQEEIDRLTKDLCTFVGLGDKKAGRTVLEISNKFRSKIKGRKGDVPMAQDKDSIKLYGDARIMAEACLAGLPLVTLNVKDFIEFIGEREHNDLIRQHIIAVAEKDKRLTDALAYSQGEILNGLYIEPKLKSSKIKVVDTEEKNNLFANEVEMVS